MNAISIRSLRANIYAYLVVRQVGEQQVGLVPLLVNHFLVSVNSKEVVWSKSDFTKAKLYNSPWHALIDCELAKTFRPDLRTDEQYAVVSLDGLDGRIRTVDLTYGWCDDVWVDYAGGFFRGMICEPVSPNDDTYDVRLVDNMARVATGGLLTVNKHQIYPAHGCDDRTFTTTLREALYYAPNQH